MAKSSTLADIVLEQINKEHSRRVSEERLARTRVRPNLSPDLLISSLGVEPQRPYDAEHSHGVPFLNGSEEHYLNVLEKMQYAVRSNGAHSEARIVGLQLIVDVNLGHQPDKNNGEALVSVNPWKVRARLTTPVAYEMLRSGYGTFFTNGNCDDTAELGRVLTIVDKTLANEMAALQPETSHAVATAPAPSQKYGAGLVGRAMKALGVVAELKLA